MRVAGEPGFEPGLTESESVGLPLTYSPTEGSWRAPAGLRLVPAFGQVKDCVGLASFPCPSFTQVEPPGKGGAALKIRGCFSSQ